MKIHLKNNIYTKITFGFLITNFIIIIYFYYSTHSYSVIMGNNDYSCFYAALQFLHKLPLEKLYNLSIFSKFTQSYFIHDFSKVGNYPWFYPPHYIFHIYLFGLLPLKISGILFFILGIILFSISVALWCQKTNIIQNVLFHSLATPCIMILAVNSQNSFYTTSFLLTGLHFINKRPAIAGLCFALLTYKPPFVLLIPFALLLTKNYKTFFYMVLFFAFQVSASILIFGIAPWIAFFETSQTVWHLIATNVLKTSIMPSSFAIFIMLGISEEIAKLLSIMWFSIISSITLYIWYIRKGDALAKAILVAGICLATPYMFIYDIIILIVPILFYTQHKNFILSGFDKKIIFGFGFMYSIIYYSSMIFNLKIESSLIIFTIILFIYLVFHVHRISVKHINPIA